MRSRVFKNEAVIAVMGVTGSGKSNFIKIMTDDPEVEVGHSLKACTQHVSCYGLVLDDGTKVTLVDTPGFDDTYRTDAQVLVEIAEWLEQTYVADKKLSGIIYLHRITDPRMAGSALNNLLMFRKLCGKDAMDHVILATTHWDKFENDIETAEEREVELVQEEGFWGDMIECGARLARFRGTKEDGLELIRFLAGKQTVAMNIQKEMVDEQKPILETEAGSALNSQIVALENTHREQLAALEVQWTLALEEKDEKLKQMLAKQRQKLEKKIENLESSQVVLAEERRSEIRQLENNWQRKIMEMSQDIKAEREKHESELNDMEQQRREEVKSIEMSLQDKMQELEQLYSVQRQEYSSSGSSGSFSKLSQISEMIKLGSSAISLLNKLLGKSSGFSSSSRIIDLDAPGEFWPSSGLPAYMDDRGLSNNDTFSKAISIAQAVATAVSLFTNRGTF